MIDRFIYIFLIGGLTLGCILIVIKASNKIIELRTEINQLQAQLQNCKDTNQQLINQIQLQQDQYNKAMKELQEASVKPVKKVYVKQVVKEPVYIKNEECQKMADLINQAQEQLK
jgi:gas vesicle protein